MLILCTAVYVSFVLIDVIPIVKNKQWKIFVIYSTLTVTAYILTVLTELGIKLPSPSNPIKEIVTTIIGK